MSLNHGEGRYHEDKKSALILCLRQHEQYTIVDHIAHLVCMKLIRRADASLTAQTRFRNRAKYLKDICKKYKIVPVEYDDPILPDFFTAYRLVGAILHDIKLKYINFPNPPQN